MRDETIKVSYVADDAAMLAAWQEEPEGGYMLAKRMGDGSLRVYPVRVGILSLEHRIASIAPAKAGA